MDELVIILAAAIMFFLPFGYGYRLGGKINNVFLRLLPVWIALIPIGMAVSVMLQPAGGFLDLRALAALILGISAALIFLGWLAGTWLRRHQAKKKL